MVDGLIQELSATYGLGNNADEFVTSLSHHIRYGEGGLEGFLARIRAAGFAESLELWLEGKSDQPMSAALVGNLLGTGYLQTLAKSYGVSQDTMTAAAAFVLPKILPLLETAEERAEALEASLLEPAEKTHWGWSIAAALLTGLAVYYVAVWGRADSLTPRPEKTQAPVETPAILEPAAQTAGRQAEFELSPTADGYLYSGIVSPAMVVPLTGLMESNLGEKSIRGGLVGAETQVAPWSESIGTVLELISGAKSPVGFSAKGNQVRFFGVVTDKAAFEQKVRAAMGDADLKIDFSELK